MLSRVSRTALVIAACAGALGAAAPSFAQDSGAEARLRKVEAEVRALQRKVFPGGDGRYFEPEITGKPAANGAAAPSTSAVTDILTRLDGMEAQIASLTSQTEQNTNGLLQLSNRIAALEVDGATVAATAEPVAAATVAAKPKSPKEERLAAVSKIAKPKSSDPGDDEYSYGYRLWNAGFYPEAVQQLTMFTEKYPKHSRASYGRNLLARAYYDDGKMSEAASWFLKNYQADKNGDRAPDSLLYLGKSMIAMKDTQRACIALAEFAETYSTSATGRLANEYKAAIKQVKC